MPPPFNLLYEGFSVLSLVWETLKTDSCESGGQQGVNERRQLKEENAIEEQRQYYHLSARLVARYTFETTRPAREARTKEYISVLNKRREQTTRVAMEKHLKWRERTAADAEKRKEKAAWKQFQDELRQDLKKLAVQFKK